MIIIAPSAVQSITLQEFKNVYYIYYPNLQSLSIYQYQANYWMSLFFEIKKN